MEEDTIKVLLPLSQIPVGSTVTKQNGTKEYKVQDVLKIYTNAPVKGLPSVCAQDGTRFLLSKNPDQLGDVNVYSGDTEMLWVVTLEEFKEWLDGKLEEEV